MKTEILRYIKDFYGAEVEHLWESTPHNGALRTPNNRKWFAVLFGSLPKSKLGIKSNETADVLNLKCDPVFTYTVVDNVRVFPGFHMNKEHWISVLLDGTMPLDEVKMLIDMSYELVNTRSKNRK